MYTSFHELINVPSWLLNLIFCSNKPCLKTMAFAVSFFTSQDSINWIHFTLRAIKKRS